MTGFKIEIDDRPVLDALNRLAAAGRGMTPAMRAIATALLSQTEANFAAQSGPAGKWPALSRATIEGRAGRLAAGRKGGLRKDGRISKGVGRTVAGMKILQDTGRLAASVTPFWSAAEAGARVSAVYAAIHQLGGKTRPHVILPRNKRALAFGGVVVKRVNHPGSNIPARPFLPAAGGRLQSGMEARIAALLDEYLRSAWKG